MFDVIQIILQFDERVLNRASIAKMNCRPTSQTRSHRVTQGEERNLTGELGDDLGQIRDMVGARARRLLPADGVHHVEPGRTPGRAVLRHEGGVGRGRGGPSRAGPPRFGVDDHVIYQAL